jgi:hypothetical protein
MGVRPPVNPELTAQTTEQINKRLARVYLLWLLGIVVGAVSLRLQRIGEVSFSIDDPDMLQGLIFVACIIYYIGMIATLIATHLEIPLINKAMQRRMIYAALGTKRTLVGRSQVEIRVVKGMARVFLRFAAIFFLFYAFLPLGHILFFKQAAMLKGIDAIFGTHSVENNQVLLSSMPATMGAGIALLGWTILISSARWTKVWGWGLEKAISVNIFAGGTFAAADWFFRGEEDWSNTWRRIAAIQAVIFAGNVVLIALGRIIQFYYWVRMKIIRWQIKRHREKQT